MDDELDEWWSSSWWSRRWWWSRWWRLSPQWWWCMILALIREEGANTGVVSPSFRWWWWSGWWWGLGWWTRGPCGAPWGWPLVLCPWSLSDYNPSYATHWHTQVLHCHTWVLHWQTHNWKRPHFNTLPARTNTNTSLETISMEESVICWSVCTK